MTRKRVCPLDGGSPSETLGDFLVCVTCREVLRPDELVNRATRRTRRRYERTNQ